MIHGACLHGLNIQEVCAGKVLSPGRRNTAAQGHNQAGSAKSCFTKFWGSGVSSRRCLPYWDTFSRNVVVIVGVGVVVVVAVVVVVVFSLLCWIAAVSTSVHA